MNQLELIGELEKMGACAGRYTLDTWHIEFRPPIGGTSIGDAQLPRVIELVNELGNVRGLDLGESAITDVGANHLTKLKQVAFLSLASTSITDRALPYLKEIGGLQELSLSGTAITVAGIEVLLQLNLRFLQLFGTRLSSNTLSSLKLAFPDGIVEHD